VFDDRDHSRDAVCRGSPLPIASDEVSLPLGSNWTGFDVLPCLDAPVKKPLVFGGGSGSVDVPESGILGYSPIKTLGPHLAFCYHIPA
jgi:hypothetical protein